MCVLEYSLCSQNTCEGDGRSTCITMFLHHLFINFPLQVNLCFDQLVYKLSEQIFQYYKHFAARWEARLIPVYKIVHVSLQ